MIKCTRVYSSLYITTNQSDNITNRSKPFKTISIISIALDGVILDFIALNIIVLDNVGYRLYYIVCCMEYMVLQWISRQCQICMHADVIDVLMSTTGLYVITNFELAFADEIKRTLVVECMFR